MKVINLGSLNIDRVYTVDWFVQAGETVASRGMELFCGGKGLNQSVALARAGAEVYHAGAVGQDGEELLDMLRGSGAETSLVQRLEAHSGHAVIQLTPRGQNAIIVHGGTNRSVGRDYIDQVIGCFGAGDLLLLQNEISHVDYAIRAGKHRGLRVALNPSPITPQLTGYPLDLVDLFILNEVEGQQLSGLENCQDYTRILEGLHTRFPGATLVLTVGADGVLCREGSRVLRHGIYDVPVVDSTGAGDTFCGYLLAGIAAGRGTARALEEASLASSIAVGRKGAAPSIPTRAEVRAFGLVHGVDIDRPI